MKIGAIFNGKQTCEFTVWAPFLRKVELKIRDTQERIFPMKQDEKGYWNVIATNVSNTLWWKKFLSFRRSFLLAGKLMEQPDMIF